MKSGALKAGVVGIGVALVLQIIDLIPCIGTIIACLGTLALAIAVGVLAVRWSKGEIATSGEAAVAGGMAGVITGAAGSLISTFFDLISNLLGIGIRGNWQSYMPSDRLSEMQQYGWDTSIFDSAQASIGGILLGGCVGFFLAAILVGAIAALAALVYQSTRSTG